MTLSIVKDIKNIEDFLLENILETHYKSKGENPHRHSESGKIKYFQQTLNSINAFFCR